MTTLEIQDILNKEAHAILSIPAQQPYAEAIELIVQCVHHKGGRLITSGMGKAGQIALNVATTFSSTGTPASYLHPSEAQHGDLGIVRDNDVMLLFSNSGKTCEIIRLVELTKQLAPSVPHIVVTGQGNSALATSSDVCIQTGNPSEVCPLGLTPTTSTTAMTVIGDILVVGTMKKINFTQEDYAKRHHGGYLGEKSRREK